MIFIYFSASSPSVQPDEVTDSAKVVSKGGKAKCVPEEAIPDLIRLVHANINNKIFLAKEFIAFWNKKTGQEAKVEADGATASSKIDSISKRMAVN